MKRIRFFAIATGAAVLISGSVLGVSTSASASSQLRDGAALLHRIAPTTMWSDSPDTAVNVHSKQASTKMTARSAASSSSAPNITITTHPDDSPSRSVDLTLDDATNRIASSQGVDTFATDSSTVGRYVSEAPTGASVITAYSAPQQSYESRTTFNFADDERAVPKADGGFYLKKDGVVQSALAPAWAVDGSGRNLSTSYRWEGSTLVQSVDVPADATFPIVADPAWSYTWTAIIKVGSTADIHSRMHSCFNCIFPVHGAPKAFPTHGQKLPLTVPIVPGVPGLDFTCTFQFEQYIKPDKGLWPAGDFAFWFEAAKGHVDGVGSTISFDWVGTPSDVARAPGEKMQFIVGASIVNSNPGGVPRAVYLTGAKATWSQFATRYVLANGGSAEQSWYWTN